MQGRLASLPSGETGTDVLTSTDNSVDGMHISFLSSFFAFSLSFLLSFFLFFFLFFSFLLVFQFSLFSITTLHRAFLNIYSYDNFSLLFLLFFLLFDFLFYHEQIFIHILCCCLIFFVSSFCVFFYRDFQIIWVFIQKIGLSIHFLFYNFVFHFLLFNFNKSFKLLLSE